MWIYVVLWCIRKGAPAEKKDEITVKVMVKIEEAKALKIKGKMIETDMELKGVLEIVEAGFQTHYKKMF